MARSRDRILDATTELGLSEGRAVDEATAELGQQAPVTDPLEAEAQAAGPFRRGLRGGALGLASTFESFVGQTGLAMGMDEFAQRRFAEADPASGRISAYKAPGIRHSGPIRYR